MALISDVIMSENYQLPSCILHKFVEALHNTEFACSTIGLKLEEKKWLDIYISLYFDIF